MVQVTKIPPLSCPLCKSTEVVQFFNRRKGKAYPATGVIFCYGCKHKVDMKTGKAVKVTVDKIEEFHIERAQDRRIENERQEEAKFKRPRRTL